MSTPLATIIFFLDFIFNFLSKLEEQCSSGLNKSISTERERAINYASLIHSQLQLMQSFCSDLLDLRKLKDGVFTLTSEPFNPAETFDLVCNIFGPQATAKHV